MSARPRSSARHSAIMASSLVMFAVTLYPAAAEDVILSGTIASAGGEKVVGATVSARPDGSTITTSVFTDEQGDYYFPPHAGRPVSGVGAGPGV